MKSISLKRMLRIVFRPAAEWDAIAREPTPVSALLFGYVLPLALIPAIATAIGIAFFGPDWNPAQGYRIAAARAIPIGLGNYALVVASILLLALIFHWLGTTAGRPRPSYRDCLNVAAYGATPVLLAGAFLFLPMLVTVVLIAVMHSLVLLSGGIRRVLGVPESESVMLLGIAIIAMMIASVALGALVSSVGLL